MGEFAAGTRSIFLIAVAGQGVERPFAVQFIPLRSSARDMCDTDGIQMLAADGANCSIPYADLLRCLYYLTPAEARLARKLTEGMTLSEVAKASEVGIEMVRYQFRAIFGETGVHRRTELAQLLAGIAAPKH